LPSPYGRLTLICNARAGRGGAGKFLPQVTANLEERGLDFVVRRTEGPGHAAELARSAVESDCRLVVAVGGDGTIHEVVNGMIDGDLAVNPDAALGVVAAGTGSDFIKTFGLPSMPAHAVAHLDGPESFPIDIGKITLTRDGNEFTRYFANIAEVGLGAAVVRRAARLPGWFGPMIYFAAFWTTILRHTPLQVSVDLVDRTFEGSMMNLVVANGQFYGGGMKVAPKAAPTDGLLDVQIQHTTKREAIALIPKIFSGSHVPHRDIDEAKRVRVSITSDEPIAIEADGEVVGETPATFEVLRDAIRLKV
jgi:diacylglycerol kinase (ATP)